MGATAKLKKQNTSEDKRAAGLARAKSGGQVKAKTPLPPLRS